MHLCTERLAWGRRWEGDDLLLPKNMRKQTVCSSHPKQSSHGVSWKHKTEAIRGRSLQQHEGDSAAAGLKLRKELSGCLCRPG